jgi:glycosyltransferase involved in cell wall biosynthesis
MRVLAVSAWPPEPDGGGALLILDHHLTELRDRHEIRLLSPVQPLPAAADYVWRRLRSELTGRPAHEHYVLRRALLRDVQRQVAGFRPDLVHLFGWGTAALAPHLTPLPTVHVAIDPWAETDRSRGLPRWRAVVDAGQLRKIAAHERRFYPAVGAVVLVAEADAERLRAAVPGARFEVVPNGVDPGPAPAPGPDQPVIGFHGDLRTRPNADAATVLLDDVLPQVRRSVSGAHALVVGRGPSAELRRRTGESVTVAGDVDDVRPYLDRIAVYVAPIRVGAGMRNKVLEALAAGRPVVTTRLGAQGVDADGAVLVRDDPAGMAAAVAELLADPHRRAELGRRGRDIVTRRYTWAASAARLEQVWTSVVR